MYKRDLPQFEENTVLGRTLYFFITPNFSQNSSSGEVVAKRDFLRFKEKVDFGWNLYIFIDSIFG